MLAGNSKLESEKFRIFGGKFKCKIQNIKCKWLNVNQMQMQNAKCKWQNVNAKCKCKCKCKCKMQNANAEEVPLLSPFLLLLLMLSNNVAGKFKI